MSDLIESPVETVSVKIGPQDKRCRYWCKIIRSGTALQMPSAVNGANDIPGGYQRNGDEELAEGDILIEGEEMSHRKARGWFYVVRFAHEGRQHWIASNRDNFSKAKQVVKEHGGDLLRPTLFGSGEVAACVRIAHAVRAGLIPQLIAAGIVGSKEG